MKTEGLGKLARPVGLEEALSEMGPNHATEFADALVIEGHPKPEKGHFPLWESIGKFREALVDFLEGTTHAIIGGVAVRSYGAREGPTKDYDVMVDSGHLKAMTAFLVAQGAVLNSSVEDTYMFRVEALGFDFDVRVATSPMDREALAASAGGTFEGRKLRIVTPDYLAAMKVKAFSERKDSEKGMLDAADVRGLVRVGKTDRKAIESILRKHRPDLLPELAEILGS